MPDHRHDGAVCRTCGRTRRWDIWLVCLGAPVAAVAVFLGIVWLAVTL